MADSRRATGPDTGQILGTAARFYRTPCPRCDRPVLLWLEEGREPILLDWIRLGADDGDQGEQQHECDRPPSRPARRVF